MTATEYAAAHDIGYAAAEARLSDLNERDPHWRDAGGYDRHDLDDAVHPDAFAAALDALPLCDAAHVSDAVHAGVSDAFDYYA